jgi:hypothetical protein
LGRFTAVIWSCALLALAGGASAQTGVDGKVAALKQKAAKAAAAGKWEAALIPIREARLLVQKDLRRARYQLPHPKVDPRYRKEAAALSRRVREKYRTGPKTPEAREQARKEIADGQRALAKKYKVNDPAAVARLRKAMTALDARYDLADAALQELEGHYLRKSGKEPQGRQLWEDAFTDRMAAYERLGKPKEAGHTAAKLLNAGPKLPGSYMAVAEYHQRRKQYPAAAHVWQKEIRQAEAGQLQVAPKQQPRVLALAYRQLAFCYTRLGRSADARKAMEKAQGLEKTL